MPRNTRSSWGSNKPARRKGYRTLRYWADLHDGRGYMRHTMTVEGSKRDGDRKLAELRIMHGTDAPTPTIGSAYELWYLPDCLARVEAYEREGRPGRRGDTLKPNSMKQIESAWRLHVAPRWREVPIGDVRYTDIQEWLDGMTEQTAQRSLGILNGTLRLCMLNGIIDKNVASYGFRMPTRKTSRGDGVFTLDQLTAIWRELYGSYAEAAYILYAFDGARSGEGLAPLLSEVEEVAIDGYRMVSVPFLRQVDNAGRVSMDNDLKNVWSPRASVLPQPFADRILEIKAEREAMGCMYLSDDGTGEPIGQAAIRRAYYEALDRAGIPRQQMRALRRSWRSWIAATGMSSELIEKMMGHVGYGTTGRHYLKADKDLFAKEVHRVFSTHPLDLAWAPPRTRRDTE